MTTSRRPRPPVHVLTAALLAATVIAAACSAGGGAPTGTPSPIPSTPAAEEPVGTNVPPVGPGVPGDGGGDAGGRLVVPRPGQLDPHPVPAESLTASVDGRRVVVTVAWTSGVEPCYVLDSIVVRTGDHAFEITLREGRGAADAICIEIAEMKRTLIDLGELEPGTYTISDGAGGAAPIEVVVP